MKLIRAIDRFLDTFEKRLCVLCAFLLVWWLWQYVWTGMLMIGLGGAAHDESSLMSFFEGMNKYNVSVFARMAFSLISYRAILSEIAFQEILVMALSGYVLLALKKRSGYVLGGLTLLLLGMVALCMVFGLRVKRVSELFAIFHILSIGGGTLCALFIVFGLNLLLRLLFFIVHE